MTTAVDISNRALLLLGLKKKISSLAQDSEEAQACNTVIDPIRKQLLRMAPWDCALKTDNLVYISSVPGTPENTSQAQTLWAPGLPTPPWAYEYQYPVDCLRACWIIPATQTGFAGGVPITTAVTGGAPSFWLGPPVKFKVQTDTFYPVTAASVVNGGTGFVGGDLMVLASGANTSPPIGAPTQLQVAAVSGGGVITSVSVVTQVRGSILPQGGSYFGIQTNPVAWGSNITGVGSGATFNLTQGNPAIQRVVLTDQEFATLVYCRDVTDPNIMDDLFQEAWVKILAATINMALAGDIKVSNGLVGMANAAIVEARNVDGNEGLTINDITPDWIRIRGVNFPDQYSGPSLGYDWGSLWSAFG